LQAGSDMPFQGRIPLILLVKADVRLVADCVRHQPETSERFGIGSPRCNHLDVAPGTISGHAREHQNPIELTELVPNIAVRLVIQNEPS
jgi:hypothetical protein